MIWILCVFKQIWIIMFYFTNPYTVYCIYVVFIDLSLFACTPLLNAVLETCVLHRFVFFNMKCRSDHGRSSDFQSGGRAPTKRGTFWKKKGIYSGKSQHKNIQFLNIGIYPYIVITLSEMISIFVSLYTSYNILLNSILHLGVMSEYSFASERSWGKMLSFVRSQCEKLL